MDLSKLKEKLGDETFAQLETYVADLTGQRDAARAESIDGRKKLKTEVEQLRGIKGRLFERLGIDSEEDLDALPDAKGQAEAAKQHEARIKRLERELAEAAKGREEIAGRYRQAQLEAQLEKALSGPADQPYKWIDRDVAALLLKQGVQWEEDAPLYLADGKPVPLAEAAKYLAKAKPHLLQTTGAGGSGYRPNGATPAKNPWAPGSINLTEQGRILTTDPAQAAALQAAAKQN